MNLLDYVSWFLDQWPAKLRQQHARQKQKHSVQWRWILSNIPLNLKENRLLKKYSYVVDQRPSTLLIIKRHCYDGEYIKKLKSLGIKMHSFSWDCIIRLFFFLGIAQAIPYSSMNSKAVEIGHSVALYDHHFNCSCLSFACPNIWATPCCHAEGVFGTCMLNSRTYLLSITVSSLEFLLFDLCLDLLIAFCANFAVGCRVRQLMACFLFVDTIDGCLILQRGVIKKPDIKLSKFPQYASGALIIIC